MSRLSFLCFCSPLVLCLAVLSASGALPTDACLRNQLQQVRDHIAAEEYKQACEKLQLILDEPGDGFVELKRDDARETTIVSARAEAERLLRTLPVKGLAIYRSLHAEAANKLLDAAKAKNDLAPLADISRRYLATAAGVEATRLLAAQQLERQETIPAARHYFRLLEFEGAEKLDVPTLLRAAQAFHRSGDRPAFDKVWKHLERISKDGVLPGDEKKTLAEARKQLDRPAVKSEPLTEWHMPGGNASRTGQATGGTAFLEKLWSQKTARTPQTMTWIREATAALDGEQPLLSAAEPIAVVLRKNDKKISLMIYRNFWGFQAVDVKTGKIFWETPSKWSVDRMAQDNTGPKLAALQEWLSVYLAQNGRPGILFENSTVGTLSTDGERVYAVEDFMVPPLMRTRKFDSWRPRKEYAGELGEAVHHNRLQAFAADTGKLLWEIGKRDDPTERNRRGDKFAFTDVYFRSPPLPLGDTLWVLVERREVLHLVQLDPKTGKLRGEPLKLVEYRDRMPYALQRRMQAAHLAVRDGVFICPTGAGMILGVDPAGPAILWAYQYEPKGKDEGPKPPDRPGEIVLTTGPWVRDLPLPSGWDSTPPMIHDGKVLVAPGDGQELVCLNLRDGSLLWKQARRPGDRYLAGVIGGKAVVVGDRHVRGFALSDGKEAWSIEAGTPSGRGAASGGIYYLPLKSAIGTKEPEIWAIDVARGQVIARTKSRKKEVPGNLLFFDDNILSQNITEIAAYPLLEATLRQIDAAISRNPNDPVGLSKRGELRLDKGDLKGAIEDFLAALKKDPPKELVGPMKSKLHETFTEYFQRDFNAAEKYLEEFEALCETPDREESRQRKSNFHCLVGRGREQQGKLALALQAYMQVGSTAEAELIRTVDEPGVKAAPAVWSQGRIAAMIARATKEQREPLERAIRERWDKIKNADSLDDLRAFVDACGSLARTGREARLALAERLLQERTPTALLDAEHHLLILRNQTEEPQLAGRAVEALSRIMLNKKDLEGACHYLRILKRDFEKIPIRDGKTGGDIFDEIATDKRFLPFLDRPAPFPPGAKMTGREERGNFPFANQYFQFEHIGEELPFFQRYKLVLNTAFHQVKLIDRQEKGPNGQEKEVWTQKLTQTDIRKFLDNNVNENRDRQPLRLPYQNLGHLVVLQIGHMVFGLDPVGQQLLWERSLYNGAKPLYQSQTLDPRDGSLKVLYGKNWSQRIGLPLALNAETVCLQTSDGLIGVDPLTGYTLWSRSDVARNAYLHHDNENVYVVELGADDKIAATRAFRLRDGVTLRIPDFSAHYAKRVRMTGRVLLTQESDNEGLTLRFHDVVTGKDVWKQTFAAKSKILHSEHPELSGVVEPNGKVTVVDLKLHKIVMQSSMKVEHLAKAERVILLRDRSSYYVGCVNPLDPQLLSDGGVLSNFLPNTGLRSVMVNGFLYAFNAESGQMHWYTDATNQQVLLEYFDELPMVLLTARTSRWNPDTGQQRRQVTLLAFDKRVGKMFYEKQDGTGAMPQFHAVHFDPRTGRLELEAADRRFNFRFSTDMISPKGDPKR